MINGGRSVKQCAGRYILRLHLIPADLELMEFANKHRARHDTGAEGTTFFRRIPGDRRSRNLMMSLSSTVPSAWLFHFSALSAATAVLITVHPKCSMFCRWGSF